jgi:hypothetical protein
MKRSVTAIFLLAALGVFPVSINPQVKKKADCLVPKGAKKGGTKETIKCPALTKLNKQGIKARPPTGCGNLDRLLNEQKNIDQGNPDTATDMTFAEFAALPKCIPGYKGIGSNREPIRDAGEGKMVRVVAWALDSRPQKSAKGESCNCGFNGSDLNQTDVHIVLVDDDTLKLK